METVKDPIEVSVVIVNWNTRDFLRNCLRSVYNQTKDTSYEVIVIDNASFDGSVAMVREEYPSVFLIANDKNRGFAAANNQGVAIARGRFILFLNSDTIILDNAIQRTVQYMQSQPDVAVTGCQVWLNNKDIQKTCFSFPSLRNLVYHVFGLEKIFPKSKLFGKEKMGWWDRTTPMEVDVVSGMFMLVRRAAIEQVGLMDEDYFVYAEETDWCHRFWKAGWRCIFTPIARIIHIDGGSKSTEQVSIKMYVQQQKSLLIFYRKHLGWFSWIIARTVYIISAIIRYISFSILSVFKKNSAYSRKSAQSLAALKFHLFGVKPE